MTDVLATTRCPQCAALVRPGQDWCTLCHTDLRPAPEPLPELEMLSDPETSPQAVQGVDPLTTPDLAALEPGELRAAAAEPVEPEVPFGKHARGISSAAGAAPRSGAPAVDKPTIEAMLAQLALETEDPLARVTGRFDSRGAKIALSLGVCVVSIAALFLGSVVLAAIFG